MAKFVLSDIIGREKDMVWEYKPTQKFIIKFPQLSKKTLRIYFDMSQTHSFARKKRTKYHG